MLIQSIRVSKGALISFCMDNKDTHSSSEIIKMRMCPQCGSRVVTELGIDKKGAPVGLLNTIYRVAGKEVLGVVRVGGKEVLKVYEDSI